MSDKTVFSKVLIYALAAGLPPLNPSVGNDKLNFIKNTGKPAPKAKPKFKRSKKRGW